MRANACGPEAGGLVALFRRVVSEDTDGRDHRLRPGATLGFSKAAGARMERA
jgi:hypothetical protein